jgi:hypothetical protein
LGPAAACRSACGCGSLMWLNSRQVVTMQQLLQRIRCCVIAMQQKGAAMVDRKAEAQFSSSQQLDQAVRAMWAQQWLSVSPSPNGRPGWIGPAILPSARQSVWIWQGWRWRNGSGFAMAGHRRRRRSVSFRLLNGSNGRSRS